MSRKWMISLFVVASFAVAAQNIIYFRGTTEPGEGAEWALDGEFDEEESDLGETERERLRPLASARLVEYFETLPDQEYARNPFLTREEADRLSGRLAVLAGSALASRPTLNGTLWSPRRRVAWLDGRPRSEGDEFSGYTIERIEREAVVLRAGDEKVRLQVGRGRQDGQHAGSIPEGGEDEE